MAEQAYEQFEEYEVPAGGIADFIVPDEEIEAMDRADAERSFGDSGIANFKDVAARMADYGRYGDDTVAHVQTGEIVIPAALIADNPTLKESIFDDLRARGIDDPERYVVGSPENSINPETGLPEFFLKKIFKGVKKAFKKVGKFLKKAATIVLPIALSFTPLGPVFGSALGSGIASLINGGSLKDAFKAAAIAGATGGVLKGIGSVMQGGTFMGGIREAVQIGPFAPAGAGAGAAGANVPVLDAVPSVSGGELTAKGMQEAAAAKAGAISGGLPPVTDAVPVFDRAADIAARNLANTQQVSAALDASLQPLAGPGAIPGGTATTFTPGVGAGAPSGVTRAIAMRPGETVQQALARAGGGASTVRNTLATSQPFTTAPASSAAGVGSITIPSAAAGAGASGVSQAAVPSGTVAPAPAPAPAPTATPTAASEAINRAAANVSDTAAEQQGFFRKLIPDPVEDFYAKYLSPSRDVPSDLFETPTYKNAIKQGITPDKAYEMALQKEMPGLGRYLPLATLGLGAAYLGGAFETPEVQRPGLIPSYTGMDLLRQNPEQYNLSYTGRPPAPLPGEEGYQPLQYIAEGGEVFPRRNGGIMPNEGVPDEDSVRALLMPGEFVMTKDAVRGLGNGSVDQGIKNMYSVMRGLERRGRAA